MNRNNGAFGRTLTRFFVACLVLGALHAGAAAHAARATASESAPLDVAAIVPTPADLATAGLDGFGLYRAVFQTIDDVAVQMAEEGDLDATSARTLLEASGFRRGYTATLMQPDVAGDPSSSAHRRVVAYARVYRDATGAASVFDALRRTAGNNTIESVETVELGNDAQLTRIATTDAIAETPIAELRLDVRSGNLTIGVAIVDQTGGHPSAGTVTALGARILERSEQVAARETAPLSSQALLVSGDDVVLGGQYYQWLDGEAIAEYGATEEATAAFAETMTRIEAREGFHVWQRLPAGVAGPYDDTFYYGTLLRFANADDAAASLDGLLDGVRRHGFDNVEAVPDATGFGDQSTGYTARITWTYQGTAYTSWYRVFAIRVGAVTANVMFVAPEPPPATTLRNIAAGQTRCLELGACPDWERFSGDQTGREAIDPAPGDIERAPLPLT